MKTAVLKKQLRGATCFLALFTLASCAGAGNPPPPSSMGAGVVGPLQGISADPSMPLEDLPNGSFIQVRSNLTVYIDRLSMFEPTGMAVASFQAGGVHGYGPGSDGWKRAQTPYVDSNARNCTFSFDLAKVRRLGREHGVLTLEAGKQLRLSAKRVARSGPRSRGGTVSMRTGGHDSFVREFSCDQMTIGEVEQDVFGGRIEFFIQTGPNGAPLR